MRARALSTTQSRIYRANCNDLTRHGPWKAPVRRGFFVWRCQSVKLAIDVSGVNWVSGTTKACNTLSALQRAAFPQYSIDRAPMQRSVCGLTIWNCSSFSVSPRRNPHHRRSRWRRQNRRHPFNMRKRRCRPTSEPRKVRRIRNTPAVEPAASTVMLPEVPELVAEASGRIGNGLSLPNDMPEDLIDLLTGGTLSISRTFEVWRSASSSTARCAATCWR